MCQKLNKLIPLFIALTLSLSSSAFAIWKPFSCQIQLIQPSGEIVAQVQHALDNKGPLKEPFQLDTTSLGIPEISVILRPTETAARTIHYLEIYLEKTLLGRSSFIYTQNRVDLTVPLPQGESEESLFLQAECHLGKTRLYGPL